METGKAHDWSPKWYWEKAAEEEILKRNQGGTDIFEFIFIEKERSEVEQ